MRRPYFLDLLVSSPSDLSKEREHVKSICDEWNDYIGKSKNVIIDVKMWERDLCIDSRENAQQLINDQLLNASDILFAMFGKKVGTPTKDFDSGTLEEIYRFKKSFFIYFLDYRYSINEVEVRQISKLKKFKEYLKENGSYKEIKDLNDLRRNFMMDLTHHVDKHLESLKEAEFKPKLAKATRNLKGADWIDISITSLINKYLSKNYPDVLYKKGITFAENRNLWRALQSYDLETLKNYAQKAREYAFSEKYGDYDYSKDLRSKYLDWFDEIHRLLEKYNKEKDLRVIGVGSNNGKELMEIFVDSKKNNFKNSKIDAIDISEKSIESGRRKFKDISFFHGDMEKNNLKSNNYDVYLNLRAIHSSGVDYQAALAECHRVLKSDGIAIISISNGYLLPKKEGSSEFFTMAGLYDNRTGHYLPNKPMDLATKIERKLKDYGFKSTEIHTGKAEIFVFGQK